MVNRSDRPGAGSSRALPATTETLIIGNGPSSLALSFLLHGNVPYYNATRSAAHPDAILHAKLSEGDLQGKPLYAALGGDKLDRLVEHFDAAGYYSHDAWPVNVLLDALLWPNASLGASDTESTLTFRQEEAFRRDHVVLGSAAQAGGQWADDETHFTEAGEEVDSPRTASSSGTLSSSSTGDTARTLSYAEQLSLPGYSFSQWHNDTRGTPFPAYERPRRPLVSAYYAAYPHHVGLCDALYNGTRVTCVERITQDTAKRIRYRVRGSHADGQTFGIDCRHVVLACGLYSSLIEPPALLLPYIKRPSSPSALAEGTFRDTAATQGPLLVIGSGFSAADAVIENLEHRAIIHVYKWDTATYTSPLKHCHRSSYPEYADVYKRMKVGAGSHTAQGNGQESRYQAFADVEIVSIQDASAHKPDSRHPIRVTVQHRDGTRSMIEAGEMVVLTGRRTSLDFLGPDALQTLGIDEKHGWMSKVGLRTQITAEGPALTVLSDFLCIGSITGDSLIKFSYGAVMGAAMQILEDTS